MPTISNLPTINTATEGMVFPILDETNTTGKMTFSYFKGYIGAGFAGSKGNTGNTGAPGARGFTGFSGSRGILGYDGSKGYNGSIGTTGYVGSGGIQGPAGGYTGSASTAAGYAGSVGYIGSIGTLGFIGSRGYVGSKGLGLTGYIGSASTEAGYAGSRGFIGSRGYSGSTGFIGSKGADANSVKLVGAVNTFTELPGYPNSYTGSNADGYLTKDNGNLWIWTVSTWTNAGSIQGPRGYYGSAGTNGTSGYTGSIGTSGYTGSGGGGVFNGNTIATQFNFTDTTQSVSTTTGAVVISGGLGVGKNVYASGFITTTAATPEVYSASNLNLSAVGRVQVTQSPFKVWNVSTSVRNTIAASNGDIIYNTDTNKFQGYSNGTWVDLN